jgi:hypothetical protein
MDGEEHGDCSTILFITPPFITSPPQTNQRTKGRRKAAKEAGYKWGVINGNIEGHGRFDL